MKDHDIRKIVIEEIKSVINEGFYESFVDFLQKQRKHHERESTGFKIIEKAIKRGSEGEQYLRSLLNLASSKKPFDKLRNEPGLENAPAGVIETQIRSILTKWENSKLFFTNE